MESRIPWLENGENCQQGNVSARQRQEDAAPEKNAKPPSEQFAPLSMDKGIQDSLRGYALSFIAI